MTATTPATPKPRRRWLQFSLRTLLVLMLVFGAGFDWLAHEVQQAREQWEAVKAIQKLGGNVGERPSGGMIRTAVAWVGDGVVHRDIKPANLLLDHQGTVKILDMGLARLDTVGAQQDQLTATSQIMGTVDYMAPEQARDTKHADARADIYSLGVTLWYLLTGRPLYTGETTVEKLMAHQTKPVPSLRRACPDVSPALEAVFAKMAAKTPTARYQTMAAVIADLEPFRSGTAAGTPAVSAAQEEDARLEEFLRGIVAPSQQRSAPARQASHGAAVAVAAETAPVAHPDETLTYSGLPAATDLQTQQSLPGATPVEAGTANARSAAFRRARPAKAGTTSDKQSAVVA